MINDHKNLDALIKAAQLHPTAQLRDHLIDLEIDHNGNFVGYGAALAIWHKLIPDTEKAA